MDASAPSPLRNLSLTAGKTEPDLPNRSPRPRLRSIRWIRPEVDAEEIYPLGPGCKNKPAVYPSLSAVLSVHCSDRGSQRIATDFGIFKEPNVVLSLVNDRARQYLDGLSVGDYFAYVLVTAQHEMAIVSFDFAEGDSQPIISIADGALQEYRSQGSDYPPAALNLADGAQQNAAVSGSPYTPAPLQVNEHAAQTSAQAGSNYPPAPVLIGEQAGLIHSLLTGDFRPIVTINESAAQLMSGAAGEFFLSLQIQTLLEQAALNLTSGTGSHSATDITLTVGDQGQLSATTSNGVYAFMFPMDTFEAYTSGNFLNGLSSGRNWDTTYVARTNFAGIQVSDTFADYSDGTSVNGLNLGLWTQTGAYVARENFFGCPRYDTFESYTDGADLNGLNGGSVGTPGSEFSGAYVAKENFVRVLANDTFQTYAVEDPLTSSLADGYGWGTAWSFPGASPNNVVFSGGGAADTFDDYASESPVTSSLNSGTGWSGAWAIV